MAAGDIISIADIIITSAIGIWIASLVQNNITKNRYLKEYYINELKDIGECYKSFIKELYDGVLAAKDIKEWLKIMSGRITTFNMFVHESYQIEDSLLLDKHSDMQQFITGSEEFNENYKEKTVVFQGSTKNDVLKKHSEVINVVMQRVIDINSAKRKRKKKVTPTPK
ncbi:MAG: hypothetical protein LBR68_06135 [Lachnoclostridium sp.]|jgi:hypothetical protein|nr:hypothetical protein [Lachnoclostridium sp.]